MILITHNFGKMGEQTKEFHKISELKTELNISQEISIPQIEGTLKCTETEISKLKIEIDAKNGDNEKIKEVMENFISKKREVVASTKTETRKLQNSASETVDEKAKVKEMESILGGKFSIEGVKTSLEMIETIDDPKVRGYLTNFLVGAVEANGYKVHIECETLKVEPTFGKNAEDLNLVFKNYIKSDKFKLENFKTAILYRTSYLDQYIEDNTDTKGNLLVDKINAKSYYEYLLKKYKIDDVLILTVNSIKHNPKIKQKDKDFLISYKEGAYDDYPLDEKMKQYKNDLKIAEEHFRELGGEEVVTTKTKKRTIAEKGALVVDNRTGEQKLRDFVRDPFSATFEIMSKAGPVGGLAILAAIIYSVWKYPKESILTMAALGFAKGSGMLDALADSMGKDGKRSHVVKKEKIQGEKEEEVILESEHLTPSQKAATEKVLANKALVTKVEKVSKAEKGKKGPGIADYLNYINSPEFQQQPLRKLMYDNDPKKNVFLNERSLNEDINLPEGLDPLVFKRVVRAYLTGNDRVDGSKQVPGKAEFKSFESHYIKDKDAKEQQFSTLLSSVYTTKSV